MNIPDAQHHDGYTLIILMFVIFLISIGLMVAAPVWQTQIQRELEEELIFRGKQYIEAVRLYQSKHPGQFPKNFDVLLEERCIRHPYKDPMTVHGEWDIILIHPSAASRRQPARRGQTEQAGQAPQKVLIAPQAMLGFIQNPQIIGIVSHSNKESKKIYMNQTTYDRWLFFYGQDPEKLPEIIYYDQEDGE